MYTDKLERARGKVIQGLPIKALAMLSGRRPKRHGLDCRCTVPQHMQRDQIVSMRANDAFP